jgi:DNA invertase Pin-like site-specific DNA recombinase
MLIGYMRVSSLTDRQNTDLQRDALLAAGVDERHIFEDKVSGSKKERPGLTKVLDYLKSGDVLVIWKLDRLGRSLPHLFEIIENLRARNIQFKCLTEPIDTTTAHGELLFSIFGAMAQYERSLIQERVKAGLEAAARRGRRGGRPRAISEETLESIQRDLADGKSKSEVCKIYNVKRSTLNDALGRDQ